MLRKTFTVTARQSLRRFSETPQNGTVNATWKWVRPPPRPTHTLEEEANASAPESLPKVSTAKPVQIIPGVHLSADEVIDAFELNGAEEIVKRPCGQLAESMIIATAKSSMHAKMLAELIVKSTKDRRLKLYNPAKPIEGEGDWLLVDTGGLLVHIFGDDTMRRKVALEQHLDDLQARKNEIARRADTSIDTET